MGNCIPHIVNGLTDNPYPSVLGPGPIPNAVGGGVGLSIVSLVIGPSRSMDTRVRWAVVALSAAASYFIHVRYAKAQLPQQDQV